MQSQPSTDYRKLSSTSWCPVVGSWQPGCGSDSCSSSCWRPRGLSQDIVDDVLASFSIELKGDEGERNECLVPGLPVGEDSQKLRRVEFPAAPLYLSSFPQTIAGGSVQPSNTAYG